MAKATLLKSLAIVFLHNKHNDRWEDALGFFFTSGKQIFCDWQYKCDLLSLISNVQFAEGSRLTEKQTNSAIFFVSFLERVFHSTQVFTDDKAHVWEISLPWNRNYICGADIYNFNSQCDNPSNSIQKSSSLLQKNLHGVSSVHNRDRSLCGECSLHWRSHNAIFVFFPWKTVSWRRWHSHNFRIHWNQQFNPYGHCYVRGSTCVGRLPTLLSKHG